MRAWPSGARDRAWCSRICGRAPAAAAVVACAALPPAVLHAALAATAGTLFEATPFVLGAALLRGPLIRPAATLFSCGCACPGTPAALSLPATALCWLNFGPAVALARFAAALLLARRTRSAASPAAAADDDDPLAQLAAIAAPAFAFGVAAALIPSVPVFPPGAAPWLPWLEIIAGAGAGAIAPCATTAVALAGSMRGGAPLAAAGVLLTAGLVRFPRPRAAETARPEQPAQSARIPLALLTAACIAVAIGDGGGFVHPRLVPLIWLASAGAAVAIRRSQTTTARHPAAAPLVLLVALAFGSPLPQAGAGSASLDDVYPGETIAFTGRAILRDGATALVRYAMTCCRADATAIVVPLDRALPVPPNAWVALTGSIAAGDHRYVLVRSWHIVVRPDDPYLYR